MVVMPGKKKLAQLLSPRAHPGLYAGAIVTALALAALGAGLALGSWRNVCDQCPSIAQIYVWEPQQSTRILSHDGQLIAELFQERRTPVAIEALPAHVPQAFIAIEDRRFYGHGGFDPRGIARAVTELVLKRRKSSGGSTITQQLARHMFQEELGFEKQFRRKLKELRVALELEKVYTKDQILEAYINQVNYGRGHNGIESAAQWLFGKGATELDPAEAALLAAVINRPEYYSPFRNPDQALERRNLVLSQMARERYLTLEESERWKNEPLPEQPHETGTSGIAPYFVEMVRRELDNRYGADLYRKGYRVYTTLDIEMQRLAQEGMDKAWNRLEGQSGYKHPKYADVMANGGSPHEGRTPYLQGMFISLEPATGEIRALIGGRDFKDSKFNRATQALRQPGSVFKPFVFTAALASGIPASHIIFDSPLMLEEANGSTWKPRNFSPEFNGPMTLREALRRSINIVTIKLGLEVGIETVAQYARRMGLETPIPRVPSITIGASEVIPLQMAEAYTSFANHGVRTRPRAILRVEDAEGRLLWETKTEQERVIEPLAAALATDMLRTALDNGTGYPVRNPAIGNLPYSVPAGGKTGTTNDGTDVWFVGFTPDLLAAVWLGFDMPREIIRNAQGGLYAAPVWADFMRGVYAGDNPLRPTPESWQMPQELVIRQVDRETGKLATEWCPQDRAYTEYFIPGTEPTEGCDIERPGLFGVPLRGFRATPPSDTTAGDSIPWNSVPRDTVFPDTARSPRGR
jgi:penicillin-binding protein 1A